MGSNKQQTEEDTSKIQAENSETRATPKRVRIRPIIAPPSLSRDRIKMKKLAEATETFSRKVKLLFYLFALVLPFVFVVALLAYVFVV